MRYFKSFCLLLLLAIASNQVTATKNHLNFTFETFEGVLTGKCEGEIPNLGRKFRL